MPRWPWWIWAVLAGALVLIVGGVAAMMGYPLPLGSFRISSPFGERNDPIHGGTQFHKGVDLAAAAGTPVSAIAAGTVTRAYQSESYGLRVELRHEGDNYSSHYSHLGELMVQAGDHVDRGQRLGSVGMTGWATGNHLDLELVDASGKYVNPIGYLPPLAS